MNKSGRGSDGRETVSAPGSEGPKPANADLWEEEHWKCESERAAAGAREAENKQFENDIENIRVFQKRRGTQVAEGAGLLNL